MKNKERDFKQNKKYAGIHLIAEFWGGKIIENQSNNKICFNCSTPLNNNAIFCCNCGLKINSEIQYCQHCGRVNQKTANYCHECGHKF